MMKPHRLLLIICSFILVAVLAFWPGQWLRHATANVTPRAATGATTFLLPDSSGNLSGSQAPMAVPISAQPDTTIQPVASFATAMPPVVDAVTAATVALSPLATPNSLQPQVPVPTLAPTDAVPAEVEPIVIATDAAPTTATAGSSNTVALLLIGAAFLFLGLAFIILRRVRS